MDFTLLTTNLVNWLHVCAVLSVPRRPSKLAAFMELHPDGAGSQNLLTMYGRSRGELHRHVNSIMAPCKCASYKSVPLRMWTFPVLNGESTQYMACAVRRLLLAFVSDSIPRYLQTNNVVAEAEREFFRKRPSRTPLFLCSS